MWLGDSRSYKADNINHYKCQEFGAHCTEAVFNDHTFHAWYMHQNWPNSRGNRDLEVSASD